MAESYSVALIGFADSEAAKLEAFFRKAAHRLPAYGVQDEVIDAAILIVNADNAQALHLVRYADLPGKVLLLGHNDGGTGWPLQRKPVKLLDVLLAMDELVGVRSKPQADASATRTKSGSDPRFAPTQPASYAQLRAALTGKPRKRSPESEFPPTRPMLRPIGVSSTDRTPGVLGLTQFGEPRLQPLPRSGSPARLTAVSGHSGFRKSRSPQAEVIRGEVLLVAESLVEGRILHKRFKRYGLTIDWSREAPQALVLLQAHAYRLVVIDRLKGDLDALAVCRSAKKRKLPNGRAPVVMMFAPTAGSMERIRAGLAGCDAYLSRSVSEADFRKVLEQHRLVAPGGFDNSRMEF